MDARGLHHLTQRSGDASLSRSALGAHRAPCCPPAPSAALPCAPAEGLIQFLVHEKSFNEQRVRNAVDRINAAKSKASQGRLESFFGPPKIVSSTIGKRKDEGAAAGGGGKKAKGAAPTMKKGKLGGMKKKN